eukprot:CAMPEP_0197436220 /NCGR_PEP_ID=MMETSP1175-20131217/3695_1 /TAXON_ID=1003142 /ORGANISM="Triceratium dubium, Strain CCMP147" /LENGTH=148 /DNA_ID=CAMNT_0042965457 /DNA_START=35 /DNA_END=477 /DNA_ORIENTATION=-
MERGVSNGGYDAYQGHRHRPHQQEEPSYPVQYQEYSQQPHQGYSQQYYQPQQQQQMYQQQQAAYEQSLAQQQALVAQQQQQQRYQQQDADQHRHHHHHLHNPLSGLGQRLSFHRHRPHSPTAAHGNNHAPATTTVPATNTMDRYGGGG